MIQVVSFVGQSNSGKTRLISRLIPELKKRGYTVAVIKHAHHGFDIDREGKDSFTYREAGADAVLLSSPGGMALMKKWAEEKPLDDLLSFFPDVDLIIVEGYKKSDIPKIEVFRNDVHAKPLGDTLKNLIATVTDNVITSDLPCFSPDDISGIADFILTLRPPPPLWARAESSTGSGHFSEGL